MKLKSSSALVVTGIALTLLIAACGGMRGGQAGSQSSAPAPAPAASRAGLDAQGNVVDSSKVEAGSGRTVKGMNGYDGEITGNAAPNSSFNRLQIGMSTRQVMDLAGQPTDQGAYMTGKAWIPFYFGADRHRFEMTTHLAGEERARQGHRRLDCRRKLAWKSDLGCVIGAKKPPLAAHVVVG